MATATETLGPEDSKWIGEYRDVHMNVFGTPLRVMDHGRGAHIWDVDGNEYLDFLGGIAVNALGYAHPKWVEAVSAQAAKVAHTSNYFATEPQIELAAKLVRLAGAPEGSHVYFGNSGAEGNEAALKLAKLYGRTLPGALPAIGGKPARIIALTHGFHGRTLGALSATWKPAIRKPFEPLVPAIEFVESGDIQAMRDAFAATGVGEFGKGPVAAVIMELIQGEAGVRPLGAEYVRQVRALCDRHQALLIIDEVQTGIGRTGKWFAFQREDLSGGITPDAVTFAKGVAGGFPMGGLIAFGSRLSSLFTPGSHGSTFAGNPLGAAAALATLGAIEDENLLANAEERGRQLREGLMETGNPLYVSTRGRGLLDAVELAHPCSHALANWALERGLIVNAVAPDALRFAPPLIVTEQDVDQLVAVLAKAPTDLPDD
ncbi:acetylornithine aminotransferase [Bifidobacterium sp. DSM 109958]|uniref:Acetylornithine aminotransferase n=1 Tax=Bifidobacterium moraviense TaxID=2675323 RepID=A0A7Y0F0R6_9BIFI|nr:acetylornithine transaminase [Bifidobacterium sp. DSM 109958]NMM99884.1 acetylornithine aminotransferase [Bifidobacterium sp. DSM 109958]